MVISYVDENTKIELENVYYDDYAPRVDVEAFYDFHKTTGQFAVFAMFAGYSIACNANGSSFLHSLDYDTVFIARDVAGSSLTVSSSGNCPGNYYGIAKPP